MIAELPIPTASEFYAARVKTIRRELREEYLQPHGNPWIIGFSGGKDSTLLLHFVLEAISVQNTMVNSKPASCLQRQRGFQFSHRPAIVQTR